MMGSFHHAFLLSFVLLSLHLHSSLGWNTLSPPAGNSLATKTKTLNGIQFYRCSDGDWITDSAYATLVDYQNPRSIVGNYTHVKRPRQPRYAGTWTLFNSGGDEAESGWSASVVAGRQLASVGRVNEDDLPDFIAEASFHQFDGSASLVSYIVRINTKGGAAPNNGYCDSEGRIYKSPFQAEFHFWKQDLVPPKTPSSLAVVSDRPVQGFFGKGVISYVFDGKNWNQKNVVAKMYNVPGGVQLGAYYIKSVPDYKGGSYCWQVDNPNGFELIGKHACNPVQVTPGCIPWSLNVITSNTGNSSMLGPYTHIQMVSTTGGLPPSKTSWTPRKGQLWKSPFSAIYWFYCKGL